MHLGKQLSEPVKPETLRRDGEGRRRARAPSEAGAGRQERTP